MVALDDDGVKEDAGLVETERDAVLDRVVVDIAAGDVAVDAEAEMERDEVREATGEEKEPVIPSRLMCVMRNARGVSII